MFTFFEHCGSYEETSFCHCKHKGRFITSNNPCFVGAVSISSVMFDSLRLPMNLLVLKVTILLGFLHVVSCCCQLLSPCCLCTYKFLRYIMGLLFLIVDLVAFFYFSILSATFYVGALTRSLIPVTVSYPVDLLRMLLLARMSRVVLKDYESKSRSGVATHRLALGIYSLFSTTV